MLEDIPNKPLRRNPSPNRTPKCVSLGPRRSCCSSGSILASLVPGPQSVVPRIRVLAVSSPLSDPA